MNKRVAVMDLGTNTFHLLIAEGTDSGFKEIIHLHEAVKLGEGGINQGVIRQAAFDCGLKTMRSFAVQLSQNNVSAVKAIATSAVRNAGNGLEFIDTVKSQTGIAIELIDGDTEAAYIYQGVKASGCLSDDKSLIVDIGGGSVEFISCDASRILWKQSFEIGAARLMDSFHKTDPIAPDSVKALIVYLDEKLTELFAALKGQEITALVGSSGVFETYAEIIGGQQSPGFDLMKTKCFDFDRTDLLTLINQFITSTHAQRAANNLIIPVRVDMVVVASILTKYIVEKLEIGKVSMSTYSLKEGALVELLV